MHTPCIYGRHLNNGDIFSDFLWAFLYTKPFLKKGVCFKIKKSPAREHILPFRVTSVDKGAKSFLAKSLFLKVCPFLLRCYINLLLAFGSPAGKAVLGLQWSFRLVLLQIKYPCFDIHSIERREKCLPVIGYRKQDSNLDVLCKFILLL